MTVAASKEIAASTEGAASTPLLPMRNIKIPFGGGPPGGDVATHLYPGELIGLVGHNGAGKSTLMRALSGAHPADSGEILIDGKPVTIRNPRDAKNYAIETIYQQL